MQPAPDILIVGAGVFGVTAALELTSRGYAVALVDQGPPPFLLAASTDISKVVRMEYGADAFYMAMAEDAMAGFVAWNEMFSRPFYHETGVAMLSRRPLEEGGFEADSLSLLLERGHQPERLRAETIRSRFPAFAPDTHVDGFFHARGGWVESGALMGELFSRALERGVQVHQASIAHLIVDSGRCRGVESNNGARIQGEHTLLACGAWTASLLPSLAGTIGSTGHPVFHVRPHDMSAFQSPHFPVFTADIARTGWYGFPVHPSENVIKIGRHGTGIPVEPHCGERRVHAKDETDLRSFLSESIPALADAPVVHTRRCLYADTFDGDYWMDHHPDIDGLSVATGGSGHGFKMAPVLGGLIADMVEESENPRLERFRWRTRTTGQTRREAARFEG